MKTLIQGGLIVDPTVERCSVGDLWIERERIVEPGTFGREEADRVYDARGCVVLAGGVDIHTHIGGGKLAIARLLMQDALDERARETAASVAESDCLPTAAVAASRYLEMGYTVALEPAVIPCNARAAHSEMAEMPGLATGGFCLLGNDDLLLRLIGEGAEQSLINDYVAWMVRATRSLAVKVVNPGGISAFKFGCGNLDVDSPHPEYGVSPGQVIRTLARAVHEIGLVHPLHVHASNLGTPGNIRSTLATIEAADGYPIHLTHAQFHCYGDQSEHGMSSGAEQLVQALNTHPNVTIDVGQVMFGQTVTISADSAHQFANRGHGSPKRSAIIDVECEAGCGVVPFRYRKKQFVHALQWAIGLELFLMVDDPRRVFLTTDHPNGAPFTAYPHLMRLLSDASLRETAMDELHPDAVAATQLRGLTREYSLLELAAMTRSAPAAIMGLADRGRLTPGALADVAIYPRHDNVETMMRNPSVVLASGHQVLSTVGGVSRVHPDRETASGSEGPRAMHRTLVADVSFDPSNVATFAARYNQTSSFDFKRLWIQDEEMESLIGTRVESQRTRGRAS